MDYTHRQILAREVIDEAIKRRYALNTEHCDFQEIINERWPARGNGGVAASQRATRKAVELGILEFYEAPDHSPEPTGAL